MLDFSNEIFDTVAKDLRSTYKGIQVVGEYVESPAKFPLVTLDEIGNVPEHLDSARYNKYGNTSLRFIQNNSLSRSKDQFFVSS